MWTNNAIDPFATMADTPVMPSLASTMMVDLVINDRSNVWVLHDKPLPVILNWAEYDPEAGRLTLVSQDGKMIDVGINIPKNMHRVMGAASEIYVVYMSVEEVKDMYILPLMVRTTAKRN